MSALQRFLKVDRDTSLKIAGWLIIGVFGWLVRVFAIETGAGLYSWDAFTRVWESRTLFVRHWMPIPQLPVFLIGATSLGTTALQYLCAAIAVCAGVTTGLALNRDFPASVSRYTSVFLLTLPTFIVFSIVPYQEYVVIALLSMAIYTRQQGWFWISVGLLWLAAWSRYEVWIVATIMALLPSEGRKESAWWTSVFVPACLWVGASTMIERQHGGPRGETVSLDHLLERPLSEKWSGLIWGVRGTLENLYIEMGWIALLVSLVGVAVLLRENPKAGLRFILLLFAMFGLTVLRALNSGVVTGRMLIPVGVLLCFSLAIAIHAVVLRFKTDRGKKYAGFGALLMVAAILLSWSFRGITQAQLNSQAFGHEAQLARSLEAEQESIRVDARTIPNAWNEDAKSAIVGNSFELSSRKDIHFYPADTQNTGVFHYAQYWVFVSGEYRRVPLLGGGSLYWRDGELKIETRAPLLECSGPHNTNDISEPFSVRMLSDGSKALSWDNIDIARTASEVVISGNSERLTFRVLDLWFCLEISPDT